MYYNDFCPCNWQFWLKVKKITNFGWFYWIFLQKSYFRNSAKRKASNKKNYLVKMTYFCVLQWLLPTHLEISKFSRIRTTLLHILVTVCILGCGLICQNGNLITAIAFFTVYRVYKSEFNSRNEIKVILPTGDGPFLNPLIYYMNIAKKRHQNPCFWENCLFGVKKCILPKNKSCSKNFELL